MGTEILLLILVFKVARVGICVVLFLAGGVDGGSSTLDTCLAAALGFSALDAGDGDIAVTFFFQHLIRAG